MLKIGEFSRICGVSAQTLRFYDAEGLLCPDVIDSETGYRFYSLDKLETFRLIQTYKDAGFALEEIKILLREDGGSRDALMAMKRREINGEVKELQAKLSLLESLGHERKRLGEVDIFDAHKHFEDQPEVLGRWELCGQLTVPPYSPAPTSKESLVPCHREDVPKLLVFLPGGAAWWAFCWSRGVLYQMSSHFRTLVPNPFILWEEDGVRYMTLRYATLMTLNRGGEPMWMLYRQTRAEALSDMESRAYVDEVDIPKVRDPEVEGEWVTVATTEDPNRFTLQDIARGKGVFWIMNITFRPDNFCVRQYAQNGSAIERIFDYTRYEPPREDGVRGGVLNTILLVAEGYLLRELGGETYLFVQHKSGDYIYGGQEPLWYVFRRALDPKLFAGKGGS